MHYLATLLHSIGQVSAGEEPPDAPDVSDDVTAGDGTLTITITAASESDQVYARYRTRTGDWSAESGTYKRTGSGTIVISSLTNCMRYQIECYAKKGNLRSDWSEPVYGIPRSSSDSILELLQDAVKDMINDLSLTDSGSDSITATVENPPIFRTVGTSQAIVFLDNDDLGATHADANLAQYRINVALCERSTGEAQQEKHLLNRETILDNLVGSRVTGLPSVYCEGVTSASSIDTEALMEQNKDISVVTLAFRKVRARS